MIVYELTGDGEDDTVTSRGLFLCAKSAMHFCFGMVGRSLCTETLNHANQCGKLYVKLHGYRVFYHWNKNKLLDEIDEFEYSGRGFLKLE